MTTKYSQDTAAHSPPVCKEPRGNAPGPPPFPPTTLRVRIYTQLPPPDNDDFYDLVSTSIDKDPDAPRWAKQLDDPEHEWQLEILLDEETGLYTCLFFRNSPYITELSQAWYDVPPRRTSPTYVYLNPTQSQDPPYTSWGSILEP